MAKTAFVLGGTVPHIELINKLKALGYHVVLMDFYDNPPAKAAADEHIKASILDLDIVRDLAKKHNADLVISCCIDQANSVACYADEQLGLPHPYGFAKSLEVTRKDLMKTIFKKYGVPTSDFYLIGKDGPREIRMDFPFVIKPTDANSSKGVFKINNSEEFYEKIEESIRISREGKAIVEGFVDGIEIQVDCVVIEGKAHILMTSDKVTLQQSGGKELQVAEFSIPGKVCSRYKNELKDIAQKIVTAFELDNTPFFYQAICNDKGVFVLEFAPRIAGGTRYEMVKMYSGFDYISASINSFLNKPIEGTYSNPSEKYVVRLLYMKPGVFDRIHGLDELLKENVLDYFFPFANQGKVIDGSMNSGNRIGAIMVKGSSYEEAEKRLNVAFSRLSLLDEQGNDLSYWKN